MSNRSYSGRETYTTGELANFFNVTTHTIVNWINRGIFQDAGCKVTRSGKFWFVETTSFKLSKIERNKGLITKPGRKNKIS